MYLYWLDIRFRTVWNLLYLWLRLCLHQLQSFIIPVCLPFGRRSSTVVRSTEVGTVDTVNSVL